MVGDCQIVYILPDNRKYVNSPVTTTLRVIIARNSTYVWFFVSVRLEIDGKNKLTGSTFQYSDQEVGVFLS